MLDEKPDGKELSINTKSDDQKVSKKSTKSQDTVGTGKVEITYSIEKDNRYGFWKIKPSKGRLPDSLTGMYTEKSRLYQDLYSVFPEAKVEDRTL